MKFELQSLQSIDVKSVTTKDNSIEIVPNLIRGQHNIKVGYVTAEGAAGTKASAAVFFNGNTGEFSLRNIKDSEEVQFDFDLPQEKFVQKRESRRSSGNK